MARVPKKPSKPVKPAPGQENRVKSNDFVGEVVVPHYQTYSALYQANSQTYRTLDDEAKRHNYQNCLAMRRDAFIWKNLKARQYPTVELPFTIETDDPDSEEQKKVAEEITQMVNAIPKFQEMKLNLLDALWFGRSAVQLEWNWRQVNGKRRLIPVRHIPVNGDKIVHKWDGTPGILVYRPYQPEGVDIEMTDRGPAMFLSDEFYRDRFIIHTFEPDDTDYMFESDLAGGVFGVGIRSRIYWVYQLRQQVLGWMTDALQRISTNGMLVGYYPAANEKAQKAVTEAMTELIAKSVTTFPIDKGAENISKIEAITPATVAYDVLSNNVKYYDKIIEAAIIGQELSSGTESTGMGSAVAQLHALTLERIIRYDATNLAETLTSDLIAKLIKFNYGELSFNVKLKITAERTNVKDQITAAKAVYDMGVPLDADAIRETAGLTAPRDPKYTIQKKDPKPFRTGDVDKLGDNNVHTEL